MAKKLHTRASTLHPQLSLWMKLLFAASPTQASATKQLTSMVVWNWVALNKATSFILLPLVW
eukprot:7622376-Karenia_brevis.AAC.1